MFIVPKKYELILINDSSIDNSWNIILKMSKKNKFIKGINLKNNFGQHTAIFVGLKFAKGSKIITMDDDLQHPSNEIIKMAKYIKKKKIDAVLALPKKGMKKHHWFRNFGSWIISIIDHYFLDTPKGIIKSPFKIIKSDNKNCAIKYKKDNI